ncbi:MAG: RNA-binding protein [Chloroflexota bacterium]|nr:RNA-binding protein [Chloroflexota bacterium]
MVQSIIKENILDIYVGNLPWAVDDKDLEELFAEYGEVESAKVIKYKDSNRSKGFGFVEMDDDSASKAIEALEGHELEGRPLKVNQSRGKAD